MNDFFTRNNHDNLAKIIIVVFALLLYANTLGHGYALDDTLTIWKNEFVQKGFDGFGDILKYDSMAGMFGKDVDDIEGGRYRPLSLLMFATELQIFGHESVSPDQKSMVISAPFVGHLFNVIYYCLLLILLYNVLKRLFSKYSSIHWYLTIPFVATMLFAAHPLHTEVVANIKSRDEIMALIFSLLALNTSLNFLERRKWWQLPYIFVLLFLGSMSKEIAITFVFIIPLSIYFFKDAKLSDYLKITIPAFCGALLYMVIRTMVIGSQMGMEAPLLNNNPFLEMTGSERYATIFYCLLFYIKLILAPINLTWDYYPYYIPIMHWTDWQVIISIVVHLGLLVAALVLFKRKSVYSYSIFVYAATLSMTSNILFNIGAFMSERFVFVSLLGFALAVAYFVSVDLPKWIKNPKTYSAIVVSLLGVVLMLYSVRVVVRNMDWKDSPTLFAHDVKVSTNSVKGNSTYGSELYIQSEVAESRGDTVRRDELMKSSIPYFKKSLEVYGHDSDALIRLGCIYYKLNPNDYDVMFNYFFKVLEISPLNKDVWDNAKGVLTYNIKDDAYRKYVWKKYSELSPEYYYSFFALGEIYYNSNPKMNDSAIYYYEKANALSHNDFDLYNHLGMSYGNVGNFAKAKENLLKADKIKSDAVVAKFLGIIYGMEGNEEQAYSFFKKSAKLDSSDVEVNGYLFALKQKFGE